MTKSTLTVSLFLSISLFIGAGCGAPVSNDGPAPGDTPTSVDPQKPTPDPSVDGDVCALPNFSAKLGNCPGGSVIPFDRQSCSATLKACMNSDARKQVADAVQCFKDLPVCDLAAPHIFTIQYADCTLKLSTALTGCGPSVVTPPPLANIRIAGGVDPGLYLLSVPSDGSKADVYSIDDGSGRQRWKIVPSADPKFYNILVYGGVSQDRKYLSTTEDGTLVDLIPEDDGSGRQRWNVLPREDGQTYNILISGGVNSGRTFLNATPDGMFVNLHTQDDGSGRQRWSFVPRAGL